MPAKKLAPITPTSGPTPTPMPTPTPTPTLTPTPGARPDAGARSGPGAAPAEAKVERGNGFAPGSAGPALAQQRPGGVIHRTLQHAKLAVMADVRYIQKTRPKEKGGISYTYASEESIVEALHDACLRHGITVLPAAVAVVHTGEFKTTKGSSMNHAILIFTFRLTHADSGESEEGVGVGQGMDTGDKACNKASTGAYKYFFRQAFLIPTGDDPDREPSAPMERAPMQDSFARCKAAVAGAKTRALLENYRRIYQTGRSYSTIQLEELEALYLARLESLPEDSGPADAGGGPDPGARPAHAPGGKGR